MRADFRDGIDEVENRDDGFHGVNSLDRFLESLSEKSTNQTGGISNRESPEYQSNPVHSGSENHNLKYYLNPSA